MIEESLKKLGFGDKEILVYLTVLEHGKISPAAIANITKIKRPTVYSVGKELLKKGVIAESIQGTGNYFLALPPEHLDEILKNEERAIVEKRKIAKGLLEELNSMPKSKSYSVPKMRFIDEYSLKDFLYKQTPIWQESMIKSGNPTCWGFQDHTFVENKEYRDWIDWYWKMAPEIIDLKLISNDSEIEEKMKTKKYNKRQIKFWKKDFAISATNQVCGDYVLLIMTKQRPHYLVEIHDAVYAENLRQMFKNLWEIVPAHKDK